MEMVSGPTLQESHHEDPFSAVAAIIFSLASLGAATVDLDDRGSFTMTEFAAVATTLAG